jgi:hypothetical protein
MPAAPAAFMNLRLVAEESLCLRTINDTFSD